MPELKFCPKQKDEIIKSDSDWLGWTVVYSFLCLFSLTPPWNAHGLPRFVLTAYSVGCSRRTPAHAHGLARRMLTVYPAGCSRPTPAGCSLLTPPDAHGLPPTAAHGLPPPDAHGLPPPDAHGLPRRVLTAYPLLDS